MLTAIPAQPESTPPLQEGVLSIIQEYLQEFANGMLQALKGRMVLIYLVSPGQAHLTHFIHAGQASPEERRLIEEQTLDPTTDLLAYEILEHRRTITSYQAVTDRRIAPSIISQLGWSTILALPIIDRARSGPSGSILGMILVDKTGQGEGFTQAHVHLGETFSTAVAMSLENAQLQKELHRRLEEAQGLHQINAALLQNLDLSEVLAIVCSEARRLTGSTGSSVSLIEEEEWLRVACSSGEAFHPTGRFSIGCSVLGLAARRGEPILINNGQPGSVEPNATSPTSILALPLKVKAGTIGVLDVVNKEHGFSTEDVHLITRFAGQAAVAIEHARLYRQSEEMAVVNERQRLARELHDSVNQSLYGISMYSEAARRQVEKGNLEKVRDYINLMVETSSEALSQMRLLIFGLRPSTLQKDGLDQAIRERIRAVEDRAGVEVGFKSRVTGRLPEAIETELYGIVQEALNNVLKHAHAHQVNIHLIQSGQVVLLRVEDDGLGFDYFWEPAGDARLEADLDAG
ncbi:MAG TPA: GAF domain-containing sensor histidine kinase, partial [Anaerolineaceae bacterium]|nr:GAF domain-containing sensor histidine kinase [Anaerolineaceae bacterium]